MSPRLLLRNLPAQETTCCTTVVGARPAAVTDVFFLLIRRVRSLGIALRSPSTRGLRVFTLTIGITWMLLNSVIVCWKPKLRGRPRQGADWGGGGAVAAALRAPRLAEEGIWTRGGRG